MAQRGVTHLKHGQWSLMKEIETSLQDQGVSKLSVLWGFRGAGLWPLGVEKVLLSVGKTVPYHWCHWEKLSSIIGVIGKKLYPITGKN